ncbi:hypothetical protein I0C86_02360 [Plantactinospora sp. S1510]|uniref:Peptidase M23 n=1 Tax=Plantactinospora alkalitolerans TaxID=2789879 RepID=A0ABS0GNS6_9ACTN|nr:hypothetical protein [Plantactinospora alkalitolerans]MBF9127845.1 hypothetical protein [Plantactinospora alkalitolerans]
MPHKEQADRELDTATQADRSEDPGSVNQPIGRHRARAVPESGRVRSGLRSALASGPVRFGSVAVLACCLGAAVLVETRAATTPAQPAPSASLLAERAADIERDPASRATERAPAQAPSATATPTPGQPTARPTVARTQMTRAKRSVRPSPVAGLTQAQMDNAHTIVQVGLKMAVPRRGLVVAIATSMQESNLYNLASGVLPESLDLPNQGVGYDHDSVGLFQQRPSSGWGTVADLMRPAYAAERFYEALLAIPGWQDMSVTGAAQAVQISAFPDAYAQHEGRATTVVGALV